MASDKKFYCDDDINAKAYLNSFFSTDTPESLLQDTSVHLVECFHNAFDSGDVEGSSVIDLSSGPILPQLFSTCEFVDEITMLDCSSSSMNEVDKWLKKAPDAHNWGFLSGLMDISESSGTWQEREEMLRSKLKVVRCNFSNDNPTDPTVLPQADCCFSVWGLQMYSKTQEDYRNNLKKISSYIKPGGCLLIYENIDSTYLTIGGDKYCTATYDGPSLKNMLTETGFTILHFQTFGRESSNDCVDVNKFVFAIAQKSNEA